MDVLILSRSAGTIFGAPCRTRTCDLLVRSQTLYPTELKALLRPDETLSVAAGANAGQDARRTAARRSAARPGARAVHARRGRRADRGASRRRRAAPATKTRSAQAARSARGAAGCGRNA